MEFALVTHHRLGPQSEDRDPMSSAIGTRLPSRRNNRRSRVVCVHCHEKKIKCDLQKSPKDPCSRCIESGLECRVRQSRRCKKARHEDTGDLLPDGNASVSYRPTGLALPATDSVDQEMRHDAGQMGPDAGAAHCIPQTGLDDTTQGGVVCGHAVPEPNVIQGLNAERTPGVATVASSAACSGPSLSSSAQVRAYVGNTGFMHIFQGDGIAEGSEQVTTDGDASAVIDLPPPALQESYLDTYFRRCYVWCPILDRGPDGDVPYLADSALLQNTLGLLGSHMEPPVMPHASPAVYYERSKALFYSNREKNPLVALSAVLLFYWWGHGPPNIMSMDTVWWWSGIAIRQAQQLGLHREPRPGQPLLPGETVGLRRRIWWTLFARERLTSICTGRPCMINPDDCNIAELTPADFPNPEDHRVQIFIQWVALCGIIGRVSSHLARRTETTAGVPVHLTQELKAWACNLPSHLQLPFHGRRTTAFNADVHQLHIPYLTTVTLIYLSNTAPHSLPRAYTAAVLASSCIARVFEDFTARGSLRYIHGIAGWGISVAILALLHSRNVLKIQAAADEHIRVLRVALREMGKTWVSAQMFERGFARLDAASSAAVQGSHGGDLQDPKGLGGRRGTAFAPSTQHRPAEPPAAAPQSPISELPDCFPGKESEWKEFFPYLTAETSPLAAALFGCISDTMFADLADDWPLDLATQFQEVFAPFGDLGNVFWTE